MKRLVIAMTMLLGSIAGFAQNINIKDFQEIANIPNVTVITEYLKFLNYKYQLTNEDAIMVINDRTLVFTKNCAYNEKKQDFDMVDGKPYYILTIGLAPKTDEVVGINLTTDDDENVVAIRAHAEDIGYQKMGSVELSSGKAEEYSYNGDKLMFLETAQGVTTVSYASAQMVARGKAQK